MSERIFGFIGLGQMGGPIAANIAAAGFPLHVYDKAGTQGLAPKNATVAGSPAKLAESCDTIFMCIPNGDVSAALAREIVAVTNPRVNTVVDLSTIGSVATTAVDAIFKDAGIVYVDAPISGGRRGAIEATISLMWSGPKALYDEHQPVISAFIKSPFFIGDAPGQGQSMKMLNNFLSATALVATAEAVAFGVSRGLDMDTILEVLNASSGRNSSTQVKFPDQVLTGKYNAGFATSLITKDVRLYIENVETEGTGDYIARHVYKLMQLCNEVMPDEDFTRVYEFVRDGGEDALEATSNTNEDER